MPLYDFICDCGYEEELELPFEKRDKLIKCPKCNMNMIRVFSTFVDIWNTDAAQRKKE